MVAIWCFVARHPRRFRQWRDQFRRAAQGLAVLRCGRWSICLTNFLLAGQIGATLRLFAVQSYCGICCEFNRNQTDVYETKEI